MVIVVTGVNVFGELLTVLLTTVVKVVGLSSLLLIAIMVDVFGKLLGVFLVKVVKVVG